MTCEYVGGPRDGDRMTLGTISVGMRVLLHDGEYLVVEHLGGMVARWVYRTDEDAIDPTEGEEWKT